MFRGRVAATVAASSLVGARTAAAMSRGPAWSSSRAVPGAKTSETIATNSRARVNRPMGVTLAANGCWSKRRRRRWGVSLLELHRRFLASTVDRLAADERVAAVVLTGSGGRGEADEWSDLDINVVADDDASEGVLSCAASAEDYGDLAIWVDCSFNAPPKGAMTFARYLVGDDLVLVDWHVWPRQLARLTSGASILWARRDVQLEPFDGTVVDLTSSQTLRTIPPYSRQQRAEWELCMLQIAASRPARREDASEIGAHLGLSFPDGSSPTAQLEVLARHLDQLRPWVSPRAWSATRHRLDAVAACGDAACTARRRRTPNL